MFECCDLSLMAFLLSVLIGVPSRIRKSFPRVVDLVSEGVSIPIPFRVHNFIAVVGFFQIIRQRSFEAFLAFLAYRCSAEIDWGYVYCVGWFSLRERLVMY